MTKLQPDRLHPRIGATPFYQTAYVTTDLDRALTIIGQIYSLSEFLTLREIEFALDSGRSARINLALTWRGETQYEVIQPISGDIGIYQSRLPDDSGFGLSFHHFCQALDTLDELHEVVGSLHQAGIPVPMQSGVDKLTDESLAAFAYGDFTATLGHYLEFICFTPNGRKFMEAVPHLNI